MLDFIIFLYFIIAFLVVFMLFFGVQLGLVKIKTVINIL